MTTTASAAAHTEHGAEELLALIARLLAEARPGHLPRIALDSSLEADVGLDSLARVELLARIESEFEVTLDENVLGEIETPRDLLVALNRAGPKRRPQAAARAAAGPIAAGAVLPVPQAATTLLDALSFHVDAHPERVHALFYRTPDETEQLTYGGLHAGARAVAAGLAELGLAPGEAVAIMLPSGFEFFESFYGILMAGGVPVPLYPPARLSQIEDHLRRQAGILNSCLAPILVTVREAKLAARLLTGHAPGLRRIVSVAELKQARAVAVLPRVRAQDIGFIQYTSGSTGNPKGVVLTHFNLLANLRAWGAATRFDSNDVAVSWLPLYHDMGLIGAWLGSLYNGSRLVLMSPLDFLARPQRWLWAIHNHRGTAAAAPNFAYELCVRRLKDADIEGLDLSSWRLAANGAEPVSPETMARFVERFAPYGFRAGAMAPVFGLAECTVGLAVPPPLRGPVVDRIEREALLRDGRAVPARVDDAHALSFVACGRVLPDHEMRIVDASGAPLPERRVGHLQFRGPSATSGYFRNPEATAAMMHGDWLDSGDLAYIADGDLYPTGRVKDMIIRGGRNIHPQELEEAVGALPGIRKGCVAVFGVPDAASGTERLVVVAETRERAEAERERMRAAIREAAIDLIETPPDDIVLAPPQAVLKTSSGKLRRAATKELYRRGELGRTQRAPWLQVVSLAAGGLPRQIGRGLGTMGHAVYGLYALALFALLGLLAFILVLALPSLQARWRAVRALIRLLFSATGIRLGVEGREQLERDDAAIYVANHTSYLDALAIMAARARPLAFVAKQELEAAPLLGTLLARLGAQFVERFDAKRSVADAQRVGALAQEKVSLFYFAEGTFTRNPGLRPFRLGAFAAAVDSGLPVVPVALTGLRAVLPDHSWLPRRHEVRVIAGAPLPPQGQGWHAGVALRDAARAFILERCGEADLG